MSKSLVVVAVGVFLAAGCSSDEPTAVTEQVTAAALDDQASIEILEADEGQPPPSAANSQSSDGGNSGEGDAASGDDRQVPRYSVVAQATVPAVTARTAPDLGAPAVADFENPTATGSPLVFRAVPGGASSADWIEVQLPVQPNGTTGWVPRQDVALSDNPYRVEISRADYSLRVFHLNELWVETPIAVGNGATPTPVGEFYLLELLQPSDPGGPYGPFAFGLSGFSEVLTSFGGADEAIIGLHGTNDPSSLGTDVSHGCIRLDNAIIEQFADTLPLGTPVSIT